MERIQNNTVHPTCQDVKNGLYPLQSQMLASARPLVEETMSHCALLVLDMINDFAHKDGALLVPYAPDRIPKIRNIIELNPDLTVIFANDFHMENDVELRAWPRHGIQETWGAELVEELQFEGRLKQHTIEKRTIDCWYKTRLDGLMKGLLIDHLIVVGVISNVCVLAAVHGAVIRGHKVTVVEDCLCPVEPQGSAVARYQMQNVYQTDWWNTWDQEKFTSQFMV
jgi:nicotinamidase-related amidase